MKITAIAPVLNEAPWIGYSILSALPYFHEFIYALDEATSDGTRELLFHVKQKYAHEKLVIAKHPTFHPHDMKAYNEAFNCCIRMATGEAVMFYHPDMIVTHYEPLLPEATAWWTTVTSFAGDFQTRITKGRATRWKNIHARKFGLHYFGAYGSQNEDFYHADITNDVYKHHGEDFDQYPFAVEDSGIKINHYCELKDYSRRLEKMKLCLKTQNPLADDQLIDEMASHHPRVTLEPSSSRFGRFEFQTSDEEMPEVIQTYKDEFESFKKEEALI